MSITTIIGPMFSGKTTELIRLVDRKRISGKRCLIIKHDTDTRFDNSVYDINHITTHNEYRYHKCEIKYMSNFDINMDISYFIKTYDVIGIEEGFFFKGICDFCNMLANKGVEVIVATLDSSYKQKLFPEIGDLIAISESVIKLSAVCMYCKDTDASFSIRLTSSVEDIVVGGNDIYKCVCRKCLINFRNDICNTVS